MHVAEFFGFPLANEKAVFLCCIIELMGVEAEFFLQEFRLVVFFASQKVVLMEWQ